MKNEYLYEMQLQMQKKGNWLKIKDDQNLLKKAFKIF